MFDFTNANASASDATARFRLFVSGNGHCNPSSICTCACVYVKQRGNAHFSKQDSTAAFIATRLKIKSLRPLQITALNLLLNAKPIDSKFIQAPTSVGKDLLPFALAVLTKKVQLVFVPFVALVSTLENEGTKYGCTVVKFMDIYKTMSVESAAAAADIIVLSYEHSSKGVRIAQELARRDRLGNILFHVWCIKALE